MTIPQTATIAIIGGGFSGVLTAINVLRNRCTANIRILIIERDKTIARGLAYRYRDDNFLLNVPAGNMSAFADEPDHFVNYCQNIDPAFNAKSFISRRLYGDYLEHTLAVAEENSPGILERHTREVIAVLPNSSSTAFELALQDGNTLHAQKVVLALGHFSPTTQDNLPEHVKSHIINPWDYHAIHSIDHDKPVAIMGMGHTAIDVLFALTSHYRRRQVFLFSRRGLLPQGHRLNPNPPAPVNYPRYFDGLPSTIRAYTRALRLEIARREAHGENWRDVINELRPHTPMLWQRFPESEQRRFLQKIAPYWDVHRHRLAPLAAHRLDKLLASDQVEKIAGTLLKLEADDNHLHLWLKSRHTGLTRHLQVGAMVDCTGPTYDVKKITMPLIKQLVESGQIQSDNLRLGLKVSDHYQVIGANNEPNPSLFYLGPMLKSKYWEAVAVPELRQHALKLARQLI